MCYVYLFSVYNSLVYQLNPTITHVYIYILLHVHIYILCHVIMCRYVYILLVLELTNAFINADFFVF